MIKEKKENVVSTNENSKVVCLRQGKDIDTKSSASNLHVQLSYKYTFNLPNSRNIVILSNSF